MPQSATVRDIVIGTSDGLAVPFALAARLAGVVVSRARTSSYQEGCDTRGWSPVRQVFDPGARLRCAARGLTAPGRPPGDMYPAVEISDETR